MASGPYTSWVSGNLPWEKTKALTSVKREHIDSTLVLKFSSSETPSAFLNHTTRNVDSAAVIKFGSSAIPDLSNLLKEQYWLIQYKLKKHAKGSLTVDRFCNNLIFCIKSRT